MAKTFWTHTDRWMRTLHLYTGLFLVPWMIVYAASAFCLNHGKWINETFEIGPPKWETLSEADFTPDDTFPTEPAEQAKAILERLKLGGVHRLPPPQQKPRQMVILRISGGGHYRITWRRGPGRLIVERQDYSTIRLVHFLHFKAGYQQPYAVFILWAVVIDAVAVCLVFWSLSGIYLWARRPRKLLGGICLAGGLVLFAVLVTMFCL